MNIKILFLFIFVNSTLNLFAQEYHKNLPLIRANSNSVDYRVSEFWYHNKWKISPEIEGDTIRLVCLNKTEEFVFYTDIDSIKFNICAGETKEFYILIGDEYALTAVTATFFEYNKITHGFSNKSRYDINYEPSDLYNLYLKNLRNEYKIDSIISGSKTELEKVRTLLNWVSNLWEHDGRNVPKKSDASSILMAVKQGQRFRCVEYSIVLTACLNSIGIKSRTLGLKTKDVEFRKKAAGHIAVEVYLKSEKKWIFVDPQHGVITYRDNKPLGTLEFQDAINNNYSDLCIYSKKEYAKKRAYVKWIYKYLYYLDTALDNRQGNTENYRMKSKTGIMLVPVGAKEPKYFQGEIMNNYIFTNSITDFYSSPN